jgi:DNA-binding NarL/FixJ family response regulator
VRAVKIFLVDDHEFVRTGVRDFLADSPGYKVVGEACSARAGLDVMEAVRPDVVLMDVVLPGMDGIVATREIRRRLPTARVVILSAHHKLHDVIDAMNAGAVGYVLKADPPETLTRAIDLAARGLPYVAPVLVNLLATRKPSAPKGDVLAVLSGRERDVFRLAAVCRTPSEIANDLRIALRTVDTHLKSINRKLGLSTRADLVRLAFSIGVAQSTRGPAPTSV